MIWAIVVLVVAFVVGIFIMKNALFAIGFALFCFAIYIGLVSLSIDWSMLNPFNYLGGLMS